MDGPAAGGQALGGVNVLELGENVAAPFCTKLLAQYGAWVTKVEPPHGDPARAAGPFPDSGPHLERSALFLYLNTGKHSVTLDLDQAAGQDVAAGLARDADILVENYPVGYLESRGLGYAALRAANPRLVYVSLTAFGQTGPRAHWKATNLTSLASGGQMHLTGDPGREPLQAGGAQADYQLGLNGFGAALVGLWDAWETGTGQQIDVSAQEAMASTLEVALNMYAYTGRHLWPTRRGNVGSALLGIYPCADGFLGVHAMPRNVPPLYLTMEMPELGEDPRFNTPAARLQNNDDLMATIYAWAADKHKHAVYARAGSLRGPVAFVHDMADLFSSPQLAARGFLKEVAHPVAGRLTYPGPPFAMSTTPGHTQPAPLLGDSTMAVLRDQAMLGAPGVAARPRRSGARVAMPATADASTARPFKRLPLAGVRIADLSAVWAGPYATRLLGDMGAEVIKVESVGSPDLLRALGMQPPGTERAYNRSAYFNHNNRNKYGCSIDLARPGGRELFLQLVQTSDVVIENFRADVLDKLGLGYDTLRAVRPDVVLISMPGHGKTGPEAGYVAYGTNVEQLAGLVSLTGYEGDVPHKSGISYGDPVSGTLAAGAVMAALLYRRRTGRGQFIDLAQREALTTLLGEYVVSYSMTGRTTPPAGNSHPSWAPHGAYPCAGDDNWVAIAVRDDAEFAALCRVIGRPDLAADPRFAAGTARHRNRAALDAPAGDWTRGQDLFAAAEALQAAGVPAAPVESYKQLLDDDTHLRARGFFEEVTHRDAGTWCMERPVWRFSDAPAHIRINAPAFAEHNGFVFNALLGLDESATAALAAAGVIGDVPDMSAHGR